MWVKQVRVWSVQEYMGERLRLWGAGGCVSVRDVRKVWTAAIYHHRRHHHTVPNAVRSQLSLSCTNHRHLPAPDSILCVTPEICYNYDQYFLNI